MIASTVRDDEDLYYIFQAIGTLEQISMPQNGIHHPGIAALADAIAENTQLKILDLNDNTFTKKGSQSIAKVCCFVYNCIYRFEILYIYKERLTKYRNGLLFCIFVRKGL